jgi:hypothetical protein
MSGFLDDLFSGGGWLGGDDMGILDDPGTLLDESGGTDFSILDDPGTSFDESGGSDWWNPAGIDKPLSDGLLGNDQGGNTGFGGTQSGGGADGAKKAAAKTQSPLFSQAAKIIGQTASNMLRSSTTGTGTSAAQSGLSTALNAPKVSPMSPMSPAQLGKSGPAATVGGTDAIAAWTKLFSGNH